MRILVACEASGTVRDALLAAGHDAMSCDILPSATPGPHHKGDVVPLLDDGWDAMVAHPPCTYLCNSGVRWLTDTGVSRPAALKGVPRWHALFEAAEFFLALWNAPIPQVAVENPVMHRYARAIVKDGPTQTIQPYDFGHTEVKRTGLWLRGLSALVPTTPALKAVTMALPYSERAVVHYASPSAARGQERSATYPGVAAAMAAQWFPTK